MTVIENTRTGEVVEFRAETPHVLVMDVTWTRPGHRAVEHLHPEMEERFEILSGQAHFLVDEREIAALEGDVVVVPPGTRHVAWNASDDQVHLRIEMRPSLRWREFTTRLFAGENPEVLLKEFEREVRLPS
jgi:quercetin dioxygenase-like cupin family protein